MEKLIDRVIPPSDYQHRNGFNNFPIIDGLTENEKLMLERDLIVRLQSEAGEQIDTLIVDTLAYLKSTEALTVLRELLEQSTDPVVTLPIVTAIYEICHDPEMVDIAVKLIEQIDDIGDAYYVYKLTPAFYYLASFKNDKTRKILMSYTTHPQYLVSYNAKQALRL